MNQQFCPVCKATVNLNGIFPFYLCEKCVEKITDRNKLPIKYEIESSPKGFKAYYRGNPEKIYLYDICYINNIELKANIYQGKFIFIQPTDILQFGSRPQELNKTPSDPTRTRGKIMGQILIKKILIPAIFLTFLTAILPVLSSYLISASKEFNLTLKSLLFSVTNLIGLGISVRIILNVQEKFPKAKYFKQHSWAFLIIGAISFIIFLIRIIHLESKI